MSKSNTDHWNFQGSMHIKCNFKIGCFICNNMDECQTSGCLKESKDK